MAIYLKSVDWNDNHNVWQSEQNVIPQPRQGGSQVSPQPESQELR